MQFCISLSAEEAKQTAANLNGNRDKKAAAVAAVATAKATRSLYLMEIPFRAASKRMHKRRLSLAYEAFEIGE